MSGPELDQWALALAGSPWVLLLLYAVVTLDGVFPAVPSESVLIVLAALAASDRTTSIWLLGAVAAAGAFTGDQIAYSIGRRIPVRRLRIMRSPRAQGAVTRAEGALARRGASYILGARFLPVVRVAVNMTAGTVHFSRRRFTLFAAIASVAWALYSIALGVGAGHLLAEYPPVVGVVVGVTAGLLMGTLVDVALRQVLRGEPRA